MDSPPYQFDRGEPDRGRRNPGCGLPRVQRSRLHEEGERDIARSDLCGRGKMESQIGNAIRKSAIQTARCASQGILAWPSNLLEFGLQAVPGHRHAKA